MPIRQERSTDVIFGGLRCPALSTQAQQSAEKLFAAVEQLLPVQQQNLFGEWSIADSDVALMLNRLMINGDNVPARLRDYVEHQWQRPSVQAWVALSQ